MTADDFCAAEYPLAPLGDRRCIQRASHVPASPLHFNRAGFAWNDDDAAEASKEAAERAKPGGDATPAQIATYDQALADNEHNLNVLIDLYRHGDPDSPEHIRVAGMCRWLQDQAEFDRVALAEHLVVAIRRFAAVAPEGTPR